MKIEYKDFERIVRLAHAAGVRRNEVLEELPMWSREQFFDNPIQDCTESLNQELMEYVLGEYWADVEWFLYECNERCDMITVDDREYKIDNEDVESYLSYARKELFNE